MGLSHSPSIITNGLVLAYDVTNTKSYPGSGSSIYNLVGNTFTGTLMNSPTLSSGSLSFNGSNNYISVSMSGNASVRTYDSTTMFVVNLPVVSGGQRCILSFRDPVTPIGGNMYIGKQSSVVFSYYNQLLTQAYNSGTLTANIPQVITVVCDATNGFIKHYVNGVLSGSEARTRWVTQYNTTLNIGYDAGGTNEYMLGNFYSFAHYSRVLSDAEILQNFNAHRGRYGL